MFDDTASYGLPKTGEDNPSLSQRNSANCLGISLGKVNFCLDALANQGCLRINNFRNSANKLAYAYLPTPGGVEETAQITVHFLKYKVRESERLRVEIEDLKREASRIECRRVRMGNGQIHAVILAGGSGQIGRGLSGQSRSNVSSGLL